MIEGNFSDFESVLDTNDQGIVISIICSTLKKKSSLNLFTRDPKWIIHILRFGGLFSGIMAGTQGIERTT